MSVNRRSNEQVDSDKFYWHRYGPVYSNVFERTSSPKVIVEFGVLEGASVRWLANRFPNARIFGLDILDQQESWPVDERITYLKVNIHLANNFSIWS